MTTSPSFQTADTEYVEPVIRRTLMRIPAVCAATGLSRAGIYRLLAAGKFPRPIRLTPQAVVWPSTSVQSWIDDRIAGREGKEVRRA